MFLRRFYRTLYKFAVLCSNEEEDADKRDFNFRYLDLKYEKVLFDMFKNKRPYAYNDDNWGFPKENFKEFTLNENK